MPPAFSHLPTTTGHPEPSRRAAPLISKFLSVVFPLLILISNFGCSKGQRHPIGPGSGSMENNHILGQFIEWDRKATPTLVLRVLGASVLQTFADISADGAFKLPLPEVPAEGNFGSMNCGDPSKGLIVVVVDALLTKLPGFSSPGRHDRGLSTIGLALFSDDAYSKNIGNPGGKRGQWLYSKTARIVAAGECNNTNAFPLEAGWNAFTVVCGPDGGPHTYNPGFDDDLGWYWSAFPEDIK